MVGEDGSWTNDCEVYCTGVILAIAKHNATASEIFARELEVDSFGCNGVGPIFPLHHRNGLLWDNDDVTKKNLSRASLITYKSVTDRW